MIIDGIEIPTYISNPRNNATFAGTFNLLEKIDFIELFTFLNDIKTKYPNYSAYAYADVDIDYDGEIESKKLNVYVEIPETEKQYQDRLSYHVNHEKKVQEANRKRQETIDRNERAEFERLKKKFGE